MSLVWAVVLLVPLQIHAGTLCPKRLAERTAPCTAWPEEQKEIENLMESGVEAYFAYRAAENKEADLRRRAGPFLKNDLLKTDKGFQLVSDWRKASADAEDAQARMREDLQRAVDRSNLYYGIKDRPVNIKDGPLSGHAARWDPQILYAPEDGKGGYELVARKSEIQIQIGDKPYFTGVAFKPDTAADTKEDGSVNVSIMAFLDAMEAEHPAGSLAATLFHERVHFDDLGEKKGWESKERLEAHAWAATLDRAELFEFTGDEIEQFRIETDGYQDDYRAVKRKEKRPTLPYAAPGKENAWAQDKLRERYLSDEEWAAELGRQREGLRNALEKERQRRERAAPEVPVLTAQDIKEAVLAVCSDPGSPRVAAMLEGRFWLPELDGYEPGMEADLTECAKDMWDLFMEERNRRKGELAAVDAAMFKAAAKRIIAYYQPSFATDLFIRFAEKACRRSGTIGSQDIKELSDATFPNPRITLLPAEALGLKGCVKDLYAALRGFNRTWHWGTVLNANWVNWEARRLVSRYRPAPPPDQRHQDIGPEPESRRDRIDWPTLDEILRRL